MGPLAGLGQPKSFFSDLCPDLRLILGAIFHEIYDKKECQNQSRKRYDFLCKIDAKMMRRIAAFRNVF